MAINKSNTPVWMKVVLIVLAVVFVLGFVTIGASPFVQSAQQTQTNQSTQTSTEQINSQYQGTVSALTTQLQSDPASYTVLVNLGNTYFDWAIQLQKASQNSTEAAGQDLPVWTSAKDAYARAYKIKADDSPAAVDYSITLFYTGDTNTAIKVAEDTAKRDPKFAPAYFNLGIFYGTVNRTAEAITAFETYLKLDPTGKQGNIEYAKAQLSNLKAAK